ncbi:uncharacterized protein [Cicer arietinum]|uniref:uncharacterized protein n=1 Tax=Cicer arietinum TaxID=3827 RepID=UPI003CC64A91
MFVSYIGAVVRQNIPITIDDWRDKALKDAKDILWNDIQTAFVLDENISKENRERARNPTHPYKKSCMGYARLEQKLRQDTQSDQPLDRHILWKEAHVNKDGVVDNENVQKIIELCVSI